MQRGVRRYPTDEQPKNNARVGKAVTTIQQMLVQSGIKTSRVVGATEVVEMPGHSHSHNPLIPHKSPGPG